MTVAEIELNRASVSDPMLTMAQVEAAVMLTWWECRQRFNAVKIHESALARINFIWPSGMPAFWLESLVKPDGYRELQQHPAMQALIQELYNQLTQNSYRSIVWGTEPPTATMMKSTSLSVRSIAVKDFRDCIVYNLALLDCYEVIYQRLQDSPECCHRGWQAFPPALLLDTERLSQVNVVDLIRGNYAPIDRSRVGPSQTVIELDLFRAYELTDIETLAQQLTEWGCSSRSVELIKHICKAYSLNGRTGIPLSAFASLVLFDVFLDPIDRQLSDWGWAFSRHQTDTYEVVVPDTVSVSVAAERLYRLFAAHGLYINDAKTQIQGMRGKTTQAPFSLIYGRLFQAIQWANHYGMAMWVEPCLYHMSHLPGLKRPYQQFLSDWLRFDSCQTLPIMCQHLIKSPTFWWTLHPVLERYMGDPEHVIEMGKLTIWTCMRRISTLWQQAPQSVPAQTAAHFNTWLESHTRDGGPV